MFLNRWLSLLLVVVTLPLSGYLEASNDPIGWDKAPYWLTVPDENFIVTPERPAIGTTLTITVKDSIALADTLVTLKDMADRNTFVTLWAGKSDAVGDFVVTKRLEPLMKDEAGRTLELVPGHEYSIGVYIDRSRMRAARRMTLATR